MSLSATSRRANQLEPSKSANHNKERGIYCPFCKKNGELEAFYRGHKLHDENNKVCCPILKKFTCPKCKVTGEHTAGYCPSEPGCKKTDKGRKGAGLNDSLKKQQPEREPVVNKGPRRRSTCSNTSLPIQLQLEVSQTDLQPALQFGDQYQQQQQAQIAATGEDMNDVMTAYRVRRHLFECFELLLNRIKSLRVANAVKIQLDVLDALIGELNK